MLVRSALVLVVISEGFDLLLFLGNCCFRVIQEFGQLGDPGGLLLGFGFDCEKVDFEVLVSFLLGLEEIIG